MKKKIVTLAVMCVILLLAGSLTSASEKSAGGYSYKDTGGQIDPIGYFTVEGVDIRMREESIDFVMTGKEATVSFNKSLAADGFTLRFAGVPENTLQTAEIVLADVEKAEQELGFAFSRLNDLYSGFTVNDAARSYMIDGSFYLDNETDFVVTYDEDTRSVNYGSNSQITIMNQRDGGAFKGFSSGKVNMTIRLVGKKGSIFRLNELNMQRWGKQYSQDNVLPMLCIQNPLETAMKGATITLPTAFAMDVLADHATVVMTVKDSEGNVVKDTEGKEILEVSADETHRIKIEQYGNYNLEFVATDGINKTRTIVSTIRVLDETTPELQLKKAIPASHKVGETITFPELVISDNVTDLEKLVTWINVIHPDGTMTYEKDTVELKLEGVYEICFQVLDEAGNITFVTTKTYAKGE